MSNEKFRQRLQSIYPAFTTDVDPDRLSDYLKKEGIISIAQYQEICGKHKTSHCRCRALLDFLLSGSNPNAFVVVRNALEKENHYLLSALDGDTSCLTEDKKTIKQLQLQLEQQVESSQVLEKRLQEAECEIEKLRKTVNELKAERDRCHSKEERLPNNIDIKISDTQDTADEVKEAKHSRSWCETENTSYSDTEDRHSPLRPFDGKFWRFNAERSESMMCVIRDTELHVAQGQRKLTLQRCVSLSPRTSVSGLTFLRNLEPCGNDLENARLWPLNRGLFPPECATFESSSSRSPSESSQTERIEYEEAPFLITQINTSAPKENCKAIHGLTILDGELFIISRVSTTIEVHDAHILILVRCIELKILEAPWDIVSCKINKCLYIMNWKNPSKGIIRIDRYGNIKNQWSTGSNCGRLSITQDSNIILAAYKSDKLIEYTADGGLVREIKLSYKVANPQHAIKLNSSRFLVIHGMYDDVLQRVCLLDDTGCVLASFGGEKGSDIEHLHGPIYLAVDKSGSIFVAEYSNSRILLLDRALTFIRVLLSKEKHELRDPWSIHLDEATGRLFVVDNDYEESKNLLRDGRILIFHINS